MGPGARRQDALDLTSRGAHDPLAERRQDVPGALFGGVEPREVPGAGDLDDPGLGHARDHVVPRGRRRERVLVSPYEQGGNVEARGRLTVGPKAVVRGRVSADEFVVLGRVEGRVEASARVELGPTAHVLGDVASPKLRTSDGCRLEGRLAMRGEREGTLPTS